MNHLGVELREAIVDYLADSLDDLRSCALASRTFLPRSRYLRFRNVVLNSTNYAQFVDICASSQDLAGVVRTLTLRDVSRRWLSEPAIFFGLLERFPKVRNLDVQGLDWVALGSSSDDAFRRHFSRITYLRLYKCIFDRFSRLQSFLGTMSHLKDLQLEGTAYMQGDEPLSDTPKTKPMRLYITCLPHDTPKFLHALMCDQVREASFQPRSILAMPLLLGVCEGAAGKLESLHVHPVFNYQSRERVMTPRDLSLASNVGLRSLRISGLTLRDPTEVNLLSQKQADKGVMFWLADLLASARSPVLQNVEYELNVYGSEALSDVDWGKISDLVREQQSNWGACLQGIKVKLHMQGEQRADVDSIPSPVGGGGTIHFEVVTEPQSTEDTIYVPTSGDL